MVLLLASSLDHEDCQNGTFPKSWFWNYFKYISCILNCPGLLLLFLLLFGVFFLTQLRILLNFSNVRQHFMRYQSFSSRDGLSWLLRRKKEGGRYVGGKGSNIIRKSKTSEHTENLLIFLTAQLKVFTNYISSLFITELQNLLPFSQGLLQKSLSSFQSFWTATCICATFTAALIPFFSRL